MKIDIFNTDKKYNIIYIDPPYRFSQGINPRKTFKDKCKEELNLHYETMSDKEIMNFKFSQIAAEQCVLFCWTTDAHLPIALEMIKNNGFTYKTIAFVWNKMRGYMGKWNVKQCEICLLATKGTAHKLVKSFKEKSYIEEQKTEHSAKPPCVRDRIVGILGDIPRIELFARQQVDGWGLLGERSIMLGKYELNHIYCADCYEAIKELPDKSVDLIVTDPPYEIPNTKAGENSEFAKSIQQMNNELKQNKLTKGIDYKILDDFVRVMKEINIYIWCNKKQIPTYFDFFIGKHKCSFEIIVWRKTNAMPTFNNKYLTDKEYCLYFRKGGRCMPTSYESAKTVYDLPINVKDKARFEHTTIKPLEIITNIISNSTQPNDIVLDPFMGSGTTAVACKNLGRRYIGFEVNPKWHKVACDRLNNTDANGQQSFILF